MLTTEEVLTGFLFFAVCIPYGFLWWKGSLKVKRYLHSPIRYAFFGLGTGWTFMLYCIGLFQCFKQTGVPFLNNIASYAILVGYLLSIYLLFLTGMVLIWGILREFWNKWTSRKTTQMELDRDEAQND